MLSMTLLPSTIQSPIHILFRQSGNWQVNSCFLHLYRALSRLEDFSTFFSYLAFTCCGSHLTGGTTRSALNIPLVTSGLWRSQQVFGVYILQHLQQEHGFAGGEVGEKGMCGVHCNTPIQSFPKWALRTFLQHPYHGSSFANISALMKASSPGLTFLRSARFCLLAFFFFFAHNLFTPSCPPCSVVVWSPWSMLERWSLS